MAPASEMTRTLGTLQVFSIAAGAMISSGLFVLPAIAFSMVGSSVVISYLLAGIFVLPALLSKLELATAMPKAGGTTFYSSLVLGSGAGTVDGIASWLSISFKAAFALIGIGSFATLIYPNASILEIRLIAAGACIVFAAINLFGTRHTVQLQVFLVVALLAIVCLFVITGYRSASFAPFQSLAPPRLSELLAVAGMVFVSYGGLTKVAAVAEEVRDPGKTLVVGMITAYVVVQVLYVLVVMILIGVMPADALSSSLTPLSDAVGFMSAGGTYSRILFVLVSAAGLLAFVTTANAGILAASRNPMSMSREGLLPPVFARISSNRHVPWFAILTTTAFMLFAIFALDVAKMAKVASSFMLFLFIMVNASVIIVRRSGLSNYRPTFRSPFYPFTQIVGIILYSYLVIQMGGMSLVIALSVVAASIGWYVVYARGNSSRRSAFVHMVERNAPAELSDKPSDLESELLDILIERDEIVEDRFDQIIRNALVLDYDHTIARDELFRDIALAFGDKLGLDAGKIESNLNSREAEASTLIYPGVALPHAIPHVIVEGSKLFEIALVRNPFGIVWSHPDEVVYTAFSLLGTRDERTFHLRALMAIAHVLQDPAFHKNWHDAQTDNDLRTAVILAKRRRLGRIDREDKEE